ncbi:MAG: rhodanese-like domain-containing protein [Oscillospiraceae bacterium]|nr:rhodanese-like domain-containing protein [Oscillospiraceae bacterium]
MKRYLLLAVCFLALAALAAHLLSEPELDPELIDTASVRTITATQGRELMHDGGAYVLIDVRTEEEFITLHIPGAILLPDTMLAGRIAEVAPDWDTRIILYCQTGRRSAGAAVHLVELGYINVYDMGGIVNWPYETVSG